MILDLGPMGQIETAKPDSLAVAFEFTSLWAGENDSSVLARLCAGAIGIYIDKTARLPKYRPFVHKPLEYGHTCLDRLLRANVLPTMIYEQGAKCLADMAKQIPTEKEVKEQANFIHSGGADT
jgi:hypothetical protein